MQSLDVISVNLWQILISLANLVILFLILKKLLFKPVNKVLDERQQILESKYLEADKAAAQADESKKEWEKKLRNSETEAAAILKTASDDAKRIGEKIVAEAKDKAEGIVRQAQTEAELEHHKAIEGIKREVVDISASLTEKLLGREISVKDHHTIIDSFIDEIGESHE